MRQAEGVLITGVYGSGQSSVAAEIAYLREQQGEQHGERFALLGKFSDRGTSCHASYLRSYVTDMPATLASRLVSQQGPSSRPVRSPASTRTATT